MTLRELLDSKFPKHHFTSRGIESKQDDLTVTDYAQDKDINGRTILGNFTANCTGKRGGRVAVIIVYAQTRRSYRVH